MCLTLFVHEFAKTTMTGSLKSTSSKPSADAVSCSVFAQSTLCSFLCSNCMDCLKWNSVQYIEHFEHVAFYI